MVEKFTHAEVARILDLDEAEVGELLARARQDLHQQVSVPVLIIEDETLIAMELIGSCRSMGHTVVGVASREAMARRAGRADRPGLVLCDIKLLDEDNGIAAAQRILQRFDVPVVFVTAFSEMLLTGGRLEPAFVVAKPFEEETLKVTVAQALSTYASPGPPVIIRRTCWRSWRRSRPAASRRPRGSAPSRVSLPQRSSRRRRGLGLAGADVAQVGAVPPQSARRGRSAVQMPLGGTITSDSGSLRRHKSPVARQISSVCP